MKNDYPTLIHIKAESKFISVNGLFPENIAEGLLRDLRDNFQHMAATRGLDEEEKLVVKMCVHNPKLL